MSPTLLNSAGHWLYIAVSDPLVMIAMTTVARREMTAANLFQQPQKPQVDSNVLACFGVPRQVLEGEFVGSDDGVLCIQWRTLSHWESRDE